MAGRVVNRLRVLRAEKKWSQDQLAQIVGISRQAVNAIENGRHDPGVTLAFRIADALGVEIADAFRFEKDKES